MPITVIMAETWEQYEKVCAKRGLDHKDRKQAVPLVTWTCRYRLWGRNLRNCTVLRVGNIEPAKLELFRSELRKSGWGKE